MMKPDQEKFKIVCQKCNRGDKTSSCEITKTIDGDILFICNACGQLDLYKLQWKQD